MPDSAAEAPLAAKRRRWWRSRGLWIALACAAAIAFGAYKLRTSSFQWGLFAATFTNLDLRWLAGSVVLLLLTYVGRAVRWRVMILPLRNKPSLMGLCSATLIGFTAVVLLGRAGEVVRPYLIAVKERLPFSSQMAAWFLERILDLLIVLLVFGYALANMPAGVHVGPALAWVLKTGGYLITIIGAASVLVLLAFRFFSQTAQKRILSALSFLPERHFARVERTVAAFAAGMDCMRTRRGVVMLAVYTVLEWALIFGGYVCLFHSFGATARFGYVETLIFLGFIAFGSIVQIPGIGGGVQIVAVVVLTQIFGITIEQATGVAILIWVVSFATVVPFGLAMAFHEGINWRKFRHLPEDVPAEASL